MILTKAKFPIEESHLSCDHQTSFDFLSNGDILTVSQQVLDPEAEAKGQQDYIWKEIARYTRVK